MDMLASIADVLRLSLLFPETLILVVYAVRIASVALLHGFMACLDAAAFVADRLPRSPDRAGVAMGLIARDVGAGNGCVVDPCPPQPAPGGEQSGSGSTAAVGGAAGPIGPRR